MPIAPLPEADARQVRATLAIATPVAVAKELLDNAYDSGATAVVVLVSPNTVDQIEVRDNGHGIHPSDFGALGRLAHTSKLTSVNELPAVGARSLGFRGIALASINALGEVTITTRTSSNPCAEVLRLVVGGGTRREGRKGTSVGTAVCVANLFSKVPIRHRSVIKEAPKTIIKIRELLQSYAFARPYTKLSFRVVGKSETTWCYTANAGGGTMEAAMQLFGSDIASRCSRQSSSDKNPEDRENGSGIATGSAFVFEGLLPCAGAGLGRVLGPYFSVDSRPLTPTRGVGKRLFSVLRTYYSRNFHDLTKDNAEKGSIVQVNMLCPPGSYDVNVEPAKDDVVFANEEQLLKEFERFLSSVYCKGHKDASSIGNAGSQPTADDISAPWQTNQPPQDVRHEWTVDMSGAVDDDSDVEDVDDTKTLDHSPGENQSCLSDVNLAEGPLEGLNPWSIAALAGARSRQRPFITEPTSGEAGVLSTLPASSVSRPKSPPLAETRRPEVLAEYHPRCLPVGQPAAGTTSSVPGGPYRRPSLATGTRPVRKSCAARSHGALFTGRQARGAWAPPVSHAEPLHSRSSPTGLVQTKLSFGGQAALQHKQRSEEHRRSQPVNPNRPGAERLGARDGHRGPRTMESGLFDEKPDENVTRPNVRQVSHPQYIQTTSPDEALSGGIAQDAVDERLPRTRVPPEDRRAYLMKRQRAMVRDPEKKLRRLRTDLLPLEATPPELETQSLTLTLHIDICQLSEKILALELQAGDGERENDYLEEWAKGEGIAAIERLIASIVSDSGAELAA